MVRLGAWVGAKVTTVPSDSAKPRTDARLAVMARTGGEWLMVPISCKASGVTASAAWTRTATPPAPRTAMGRPRRISETARSTARRETGSLEAGIDINSKCFSVMVLEQEKEICPQEVNLV